VKEFYDQFHTHSRPAAQSAHTDTDTVRKTVRAPTGRLLLVSVMCLLKNSLLLLATKFCCWMKPH